MTKLARRTRHTYLAMLSLAAVAAGLFLGSSPAIAGVDGGNNGGGGGGTGYNPNYEVWSVYNERGAWSDFANRALGDRYSGESALVTRLNAISPGLAANCQRSRLIVWLQATGSRWGSGSGFLYVGGNNTNVARTIADWGDRTYFWDGNMNNFGTSGQQQVGVFVQAGSVDAGARTEVKNWAYNGGNYHRGTVIVCAWNDPTSCPSCGETYTRMVASSTAAESWTYPYSHATSVRREITAPEGSNLNDPTSGDIATNGDDPIGIDNLHDQPAVVQRTSFGAIHDSLASSTSEELSSLRARIAAAVATDANADRPDVVLDSNNRAGLLEGGVLSVYQHTTRATITATQTETWEKCETNVVRQNFDPALNRWGSIYIASSGVADCSTRASWTAKASDAPAGVNAAWFASNEWDRTGSNTLTVKTLTTPQNTSFWQVVSVHCNPDDMAAALAAYGTEGVDYRVVSQTVSGGGVTVVVYTQPVSSRPVGPTARIFGVRGGAADYASATPLQRTGMTGFYDKECVTVCLPIQSDDATTANGAVDNVSIISSDKNRPARGGAVLDGGLNSNYFEVFRNGEFHELEVNVSYPRDSVALRYNGSAPISTTVNLWNASTPDTTPYGGQFIMRTANGQPVFNPNGAAPATQRNFGRDLYQSPLSATLSGLHRTFQIAGTWASTQTRPVIANVKWEYQVTTPTTIPTTLGFVSGGGVHAAGLTTMDQALDVRCYATFGSTNSDHLDLAGLTHDYTGTGTTNLLDARLIEGPGNEAGFPSDDNATQSARATSNGDAAYTTSTNLVIKFIRAVAN